MRHKQTRRNRLRKRRKIITKGLLGFCLFCSGGKFGGSGDFGYLFFQGGASVKESRSTSDNSMEGSVRVCTC